MTAYHLGDVVRAQRRRDGHGTDYGPPGVITKMRPPSDFEVRPLDPALRVRWFIGPPQLVHTVSYWHARELVLEAAHLRPTFTIDSILDDAEAALTAALARHHAPERDDIVLLSIAIQGLRS